MVVVVIVVVVLFMTGFSNAYRIGIWFKCRLIRFQFLCVCLWRVGQCSRFSGKNNGNMLFLVSIWYLLASVSGAFAMKHRSLAINCHIHLLRV